MADKIYNVLFLCTGNSARSVMAEALLNRWGQGRFQAFSAGSHPKGDVHPETLATLKLARLPIEGLRSKSWDEFAVPGAPEMDFVFTVCDNAAGEMCPIWPGQPMTAHWGFPDPAAATGTAAEVAAVFADVFKMIERRIQVFCSLPLASLSRLQIQREIAAMGKGQPEAVS
jgi:protein-tyrosine-phosphatase